MRPEQVVPELERAFAFKVVCTCNGDPTRIPYCGFHNPDNLVREITALRERAEAAEAAIEAAEEKQKEAEEALQEAERQAQHLTAETVTKVWMEKFILADPAEAFRFEHAAAVEAEKVDSFWYGLILFGQEQGYTVRKDQ